MQVPDNRPLTSGRCAQTHRMLTRFRRCGRRGLRWNLLYTSPSRGLELETRCGFNEQSCVGMEWNELVLRGTPVDGLKKVQLSFAGILSRCEPCYFGVVNCASNLVLMTLP